MDRSVSLEENARAAEHGLLDPRSVDQAGHYAPDPPGPPGGAQHDPWRQGLETLDSANLVASFEFHRPAGGFDIGFVPAP
jgi:hypothetical protein